MDDPIGIGVLVVVGLLVVCCPLKWLLDKTVKPYTIAHRSNKHEIGQTSKESRTQEIYSGIL